MARSLVCVLVPVGIAIMAAAFAPQADASSCPAPSCVVNSFGMSALMGTLEVETADGTVVYTANDLLLTNGPVPDDLASQIETDSGVPTYIQNNIGLLDGGNDFDFIESPAADFPPILLGVNGSTGSAANCTNIGACVAVDEADLESISLAPVTSVTSNLLYLDDYVIEGLNSDQSVLAQGIISVGFYDDVVIETEGSAVPEPKSALMLGCVILALVLFRRMRVSRRGRCL